VALHKFCAIGASVSGEAFLTLSAETCLCYYDSLPLGAKAQSVYAWDEARRFSGFSPR
jgi:hypothetical protein